MKLFEAEPRTSYNLAQLARHLGVSKATCLPMINELTRSGWLTRHPARKTYRLGPALIPLGRAAEKAADLTDVLAPAMRRLAEATGHTIATWVPSGRSVQLGDIVGPRGPLETLTGLKPGHRLLVAPPFASSLVTWDSAEAVDDWIGRTKYQNPEAARERYLSAIAASRGRGFIVELSMGDLVHEVFFLVQRLRAERNDRVADVLTSIGASLAKEANDLESIVVDIKPKNEYSVTSINAPMFGPSGAAELILSISANGAPMPGKDVMRFGTMVHDAAVELTHAIGGHWPS